MSHRICGFAAPVTVLESSLESRVLQLERRVRTFQVTTCILLLAVCAIAFMGQAPAPKTAKVVAAESFVLRSPDGNTVGQWGIFGGRAAFSLWAGGSPKFVVGTDAAGMTAMQMEGPSGVSIAMSAQKDTAIISFMNHTGKPVGMLGIDDTGRFSSTLPK